LIGVTGSTTPDVTGTYAPAGNHNGHVFYARDDNAWFIWDKTGTPSYTITDEVGGGTAPADPEWLNFTPGTILGAYTPAFPAVGTPTVAYL